MTFKLPELPYPKNALSPAVSADTLEYHHGKHHQSYVDKLNAAIDGTPLADLALEEIIVASAGKPDQTNVFNNAAQTWNHNMLWPSMSPDGGGKPDGALARQIDADFGGFKDFRDKFIKAGAGQFGSGWVWLVVENGKLAIRATGNADTPLVDGHEVLMTCDVWEHAYYLDYQNRRQAYLEAFIDKLANWSFAADRFANQGEGNRTAARHYREAQEAFAKSGNVDEAARRAQHALDSSEGRELERARRASSAGSD